MHFQFNGTLYQFTYTELAVAALVVVLVLFIAVAASVERRKKKTLALRDRFGTEYDRAVVTDGSPRKAEAKLADREARVEKLVIRDLGVAEHDRFVSDWQVVQSRFVDHPKTSVTEADDLIAALLEARGYPQVSFEQRAADVSVTYPRIMEKYRLAHEVAVRLGQVDASTEELRTAMIQFRSIFDELALPQRPSEHKAAA